MAYIEKLWIVETRRHEDEPQPLGVSARTQSYFDSEDDAIAYLVDLVKDGHADDVRMYSVTGSKQAAEVAS